MTRSDAAARRNWSKNSLNNRANLLGEVFSAAYGEILKRMNAVIRTANYPLFKDCKKRVKGPTLADADAALAEAKAAQKAMDKMDDLIGGANIPDTGAPASKGTALKKPTAGKTGITQFPVSPKPRKILTAILGSTGYQLQRHLSQFMFPKCPNCRFARAGPKAAGHICMNATQSST